jgi:Co/Zn/Cd efflux system component
MAGCCSGCHAPVNRQSDRFRKVLWVALAINAGMFLVEILAGVAAGSSSLQADALDFLGDAANYGVSLFVLGMSLRRRATASLLKGATMGAFGLWVIGNTGWHLLNDTIPAAGLMGAVGIAALVANLAVAVILYAFRDGDSNMRSVWICSRNDAIGNLAVLAAASGVFATGSGWPDFAVAGIMAALAISGAAQVLRHALAELRTSPQAAPAGTT